MLHVEDPEENEDEKEMSMDNSPGPRRPGDAYIITANMKATLGHCSKKGWVSCITTATTAGTISAIR